jgi:serine/threonine-protein kinase RsbW
MSHTVTAPDRDPLVSRSFVGADIPSVRTLVSGLADQAGLGQTRREDFVLAVDEILSNAVRHGGGAGHLELWLADGTIWFRVSDDGPGMAVRPVAQSPTPTQIGGRGLWIAERLSDELRISSGPDGTTVSGAFRLKS